jgi:hypothetical protein
MTDEAKKEDQLLDLGEPRVISFRDRGCKYSYTFYPIAAKDWMEYFEAIVNIAYGEGNVKKQIHDLKSAKCAMVRRLVAAVDGYVGEFAARDDWREMLPGAHVELVGDQLQSVAVDTSVMLPIDPLHPTVALCSNWTADENGKLLQFYGLTHKFSAFMTEHEVRLNRAMSTTKVVGSGRNARTIYPARQVELLKLYNELIEGVDGYAYKGERITTRQVAIEQMDAWHKVAALNQLLSVVDFGEAEQ